MVSPSKILFTQDSIATFTTNKDTGETRSLANIIEDLKTGRLTPADFEPIRVVCIEAEDFSDGEVTPGQYMYWTLDNRRLYIFQAAKIQSIIVEIVSREMCEAEFLLKKTTTCNGVSIRVRTPREALRGMVLELTRENLSQEWSPPQLFCDVSDDRISMLMHFVNQELCSELASKYKPLSNTPLSTTASWTECNGNIDVASLPEVLHNNKLRPGDVCLVRTREHLVDHLVIVGEISYDALDDEDEQDELPLDILSYQTKPSLKGSSIQFIGKIGSVITSCRQLDALERLLENTTLHNMLSHPDEEDFEVSWDSSCTWKWSTFTERLNIGQQEAVRKAMTNRVSLVQGPPGTGKTYIIAVLLHTHINHSKDDNLKVLATAPSNLAVQLLAEKFVDPRLGAKTTPICVLHCCDSKRLAQDNCAFFRFFDIVCNSANNVADKIADNVAICESQIRKCNKAFVVGSTDKAALKKRNPPNHFLPRWLDRQGAWIKFVDTCFRSLEHAARVFFTTCSGGAKLRQNSVKHKKPLDARQICPPRPKFSLVVVDEAGKATQPDSFVAITLLNDVAPETRVVLVGDHKQLRPHIATVGYQNTPFGQSLMERLSENKFPLTVLEVQFRMHPKIRHVVSLLSYDGLLKDSESVSAPSTQKPLEFIDCSNGCEEKGTYGESFLNDVEAKLVVQLITQLARDPATIAVLSPYDGQLTHSEEDVYSSL